MRAIPASTRGLALPSRANAADAAPDERLFEAIQERAAQAQLRQQQLARARRSPKQAYYQHWGWR